MPNLWLNFVRTNLPFSDGSKSSMIITFVLLLLITAGGTALTYLYEKEDSALVRLAAGNVTGAAIFATLATGIIFLTWVFVRKIFELSKGRPDDAAKLAAIRAGFLRIFSMRRS